MGLRPSDQVRRKKKKKRGNMGKNKNKHTDRVSLVSHNKDGDLFLKSSGSQMENEVQVSKILQTKLVNSPCKCPFHSVSCHQMAPPSLQLYKPETYRGYLCNNQPALSHHP